MKNFVLFFIIFLSFRTIFCETVKRKRQIYREQVSPHLGGKIPDTAFQTDRLALNRLQKDGFAITDGIILEQRNPQVYPYLQRTIRPLLKVAITPDGRYTPDVGRYYFNVAPSQETTYLVPQIVDEVINLHPSVIFDPVHRPFSLPNRLLKGPQKIQSFSQSAYQTYNIIREKNQQNYVKYGVPQPIINQHNQLFQPNYQQYGQH